MKQKKNYRRERGQATMEIAIAAVAIIFLVMGFFVLGGIGITSIKSLLLTRFYAEKRAADKDFGSSSTTQQLSGWEYTKAVQKRSDGDRVIVIPFLAKDEPVKTANDLGSGYLDEDTPSLSIHPDLAENPSDADYLWQPFNNLVSRQIVLFNSSLLASLHRQAPVLPDRVSRYDQNYLLSGSNNKEKLWGNLQNIDITQWESSVVAFPAFAPQK
jgi:hypothetical protein